MQHFRYQKYRYIDKILKKGDFISKKDEDFILKSDYPLRRKM